MRPWIYKDIFNMVDFRNPKKREIKPNYVNLIVAEWKRFLPSSYVLEP